LKSFLELQTGVQESEGAKAFCGYCGHRLSDHGEDGVCRPMIMRGNVSVKEYTTCTYQCKLKGA